MKTTIRNATIVCALAGVMVAGQAMAATVWNPAGNGITPPATGSWGDAANWNGGSGLPPGPAPGGDPKAVFNVPGAADAEVAGTFSGFQIVQGDNNPGGVLRILNGGSISTLPTSWSAVGYNDTALAIVDAGGTYNFGQHMWVGLNPGGVGTLDISGTVTVGAMIGAGWSGGTGYVNVLDGGLLALSNIHNSGNSVQGSSLIDITGSGTITLPGDFTPVIIDQYLLPGKIAANGVPGAASTYYDGGLDQTFVVVPEPSTFALMGFAGLAMAFRRFRR